jgi:hypothetical protein
MSLGSLPLAFSYDADKDCLTVEGVKYSGDFFRMFADPDPAALYRIEKDEYGAVTVVKCEVDIK